MPLIDLSAVQTTAPAPLSELIAAVSAVRIAQSTSFGEMLAAIDYVSDSAHAALPQAWRDLSALLPTLLEDEMLSVDAAAAAAAAGLPVGVVAAYVAARTAPYHGAQP
jgi:hypothetical protein